MRHSGSVAAAALWVLAGQALGQQTYRYSGPSLGSWRTSNNWMPSGVPGIGSVGDLAVVDLLPVSLGPGPRPSITSLSAPSGVTFAGGGLTVSLTANIVGMNLRQNDYDSLGLYCGTLLLSGDSFWRGGLIWSSDARNTGNLVFTSIGALSGATPTVRGAFRNEGTVTHGHRLTLQQNALVINAQNWAMSNDIQDTSGDGSGGTFRNEGSLTHVGASTVDISANFNNQGQVSVDAGQLRVSGYANTVEGALTLTNNAAVYIFQRYQGSTAPATVLGFSASGQGDVILSTGNHTVAALTLSDLSLNSPHGLWVDGATIRLDADLVNEGLMTLQSGRLGGLPGTGALVNAEAGRLAWGNGVSGTTLAGVLNNDGLATLRGYIPLDFGFVVNGPSGILDVSAGGFLVSLNTINLVENLGQIRKTAASTGAGALGARLLMDGGRITVERSGLILNKDSSWEGDTTIEVGPSADARLGLEDGVHTIASGELVIMGSHGVVEVGGSNLAPVLDVFGGYVTSVLTGAAEFRVSAPLRCRTVDGFLNRGNLRLSGGTIESTVQQGLINRGFMTLVNGTLLGQIINEGYALLTGSVSLGNPSGPAGELRSEQGATFEMVNGSLNLRHANSFFRNFGTLFRTGPGQSFISGTGAFENRGSLQVRGGNLTIACLIPQIQNGVLAGGAWIVLPGATLTLPSNINVLAQGTYVSGGSVGIPALAHLRQLQGGDLDVSQNLTLLDALLILGSGHDAGITIRPGFELTVPISVTNGNLEDIQSEIEWAFGPVRTPQPRLITPLLNNYARLVPGGHDEPGPANLIGNLVMRPGGRILVELGGTEPLLEHDQVVITGSATLAGTLALSLIDDFVPMPGQQFTILTASGGSTGTFASLVQPAGLPAGLAFEALYSAGSVTLRVVTACYANCDGSTSAPVLNVNDFICFQSRFAATNPYADCDQNSAFNVNDFICFQSRFAAGCR